MLRKTLIALTATLLAGAASAQNTTTDKVKILTPAQMAALIPAGHYGGFMLKNDKYHSEFVDRRDKDNDVEVHKHFSHYVEIVSGTGELTFGGTVKGSKEISPGEIRGTAIGGGHTVTVHQGDYIEIPAGTPHLFNAAPGTHLRYFAFSVYS